jgi:hypothetical protein
MAAERTTAAAARTSGPEISDELRQVQRGSLSLDAYLDAQVERAIAHLRSQVTPQRIALIKDVLRDQLATSPALAELMRQAGVPHPTTNDMR